jgi:hypothetical protein
LGEGSTARQLFGWGRHEARWAAQLCDSIPDTHALAIGGYTDFGFEHGHVELEQNITRYFLLDKLFAYGIVKTFGT